MSTALRLQSKGIQTIILESHGTVGGSAGYFHKKGFSFDVGATTLVDHDKEGVGGLFFKDIGFPHLEGEKLDYKVWLPDREVILYRNSALWKEERLSKLGNTKNHIAFWKFFDSLSETFWQKSRDGIKLPIQSIGDALDNLKIFKVKDLKYIPYLWWTMEDALKKFHLDKDHILRGFLSLAIEDTVHNTIQHAPLINASLGATIRTAGVVRAKGGMKGLWIKLLDHYKELGGELKLGNKVSGIIKSDNEWIVTTNKQEYKADLLISAIPINNIHPLLPSTHTLKLNKFIRRDQKSYGSAFMIFLGVPDTEVKEQKITHHQILIDYHRELGNGNNMFISISSQNDEISAPKGFRSVMVSTHTGVEEWKNLSKDEYEQKKLNIQNILLDNARKIYPSLGDNAVIKEVGTPLTYEKYTNRKDGAVGGVKQTLKNTNQFAVPQNSGFNDLWFCGDTTWPGLGTVAGIMGSQHLTNKIVPLLTKHRKSNE